MLAESCGNYDIITTDDSHFRSYMYADIYEQLGSPEHVLFIVNFERISGVADFSFDEFLSNAPNQITPNTIIVFDCLAEGIVRYAVKQAINLMRRYNTQNAYYVSSSQPCQALFDTLRRSREDMTNLNLITVNHWENFYQHYISIGGAQGNDCYWYNWFAPKHKLYHCFNGSNRAQRLFLIGQLHKRNLLNKGYVSYNHHPASKVENLSKVVLDYMDRSKNGYYRNKYGKLINDATTAFNEAGYSRSLYDDNIDNPYTAQSISDRDTYIYEGSRFAVITETAFVSEYLDSDDIFDTISDPCVFLTEKTFRPIALRIPFIIYGHPGSLQALRELGYKTFHPYIDETYDTITDDVERMYAVANEVERLSKLSPVKWEHWAQEVFKIVTHNSIVIKSRKNVQFKIIDL